jgi:hypothetical protein
MGKIEPSHLFSFYRDMIDKTSINISCLIISGAGLLVVLTEYYSPEVNMTFMGENPFAIKRYEINNVMTWIFACFALLGIFIQTLAEIFGKLVPERKHTIYFYLLYVLGILILVIVAIQLLAGLGYRIARNKWQPLIVDNQREIYLTSKYIIEHDGLTKGQFLNRDKLSENALERRQKDNYEITRERLMRIKKLFDIEDESNDLQESISNLRPFFE